MAVSKRKGIKMKYIAFVSAGEITIRMQHYCILHGLMKACNKVNLLELQNVLQK